MRYQRGIIFTLKFEIAGQNKRTNNDTTNYFQLVDFILRFDRARNTCNHGPGLSAVQKAIKSLIIDAYDWNSLFY